jgi:ATP-dependent Clp protease ATP-binding subunit ClpX
MGLLQKIYDSEGRELAEIGISEPAKIVLRPSEVVAHLDSYIIGQADAKKAIALTVVNHMAADEHNTKNPDGVQIDKTNLLLVGPTGSGKTALVKALAKFMHVPVLIVDITEYTSAGYVGRDIEEIMDDLLDAADGDVLLAEKAIVFIDEVDKLAPGGRGDSVATTGVQQSLLKILEGGTYRAGKGKKGSMMGSRGVDIDTSKILFILGGAFSGLQSHSDTANPFSFGSAEEKIEKTIAPLITREDIVKYGLMREFVGRVGRIGALGKLTVDDLKRIMVEPKNSIKAQYDALFIEREIEDVVTEADIEEIVARASKLDIGARGLRQITEELLADRLYN